MSTVFEKIKNKKMLLHKQACMLQMKEMKSGSTAHPVTQPAVSLARKTTDQKQTIFSLVHSCTEDVFLSSFFPFYRIII